MQWKHVSLLIASLGLAVSAKAGFVNGGFETGDFTGWTVERGTYNGGPITFSAFNPNVLNDEARVIGALNDPYSPFDSPFNGSKMARLNTFSEPNADAVRISQTASIVSGDGTGVFVNWAAVLEDPQTPVHTVTQEPFFKIEVYKGALLIASENHVSSNTTGGGWTAGGTGPNQAPIYYSSGTFNVGGLQVGDTVTVVLTVADCTLGGHVGYAYLDGIGTNAEPPRGAPDAGSTVAMLAAALLGLAAIRRKS